MKKYLGWIVFLIVWGFFVFLWIWGATHRHIGFQDDDTPLLCAIVGFMLTIFVPLIALAAHFDKHK